ncbi:uncharacterized protein FFB20_06639 [Fusarium fujikuroi]|uniref:Protein kinase domain-containing protein n=1 Tax=Gibberella fujikuroi (strain CBS 195.34 / IMI 58289 / NRRL A-6831) TaxID=1279085 RepID=S0EC68_GIBF5|nr:uncharacterized protein FFUJ_13756 [Fusarium fujikuroi IMI 58289]KLO93418.1 uncharacterized protein Y057_9092 [Fusarium fujikuroi]KLP14518.1 uncharacterized protein LW94_8561 [Fusarium fujikuroi]CCT72235.1 uncharacterized protein FFUJ_13756 [Fusarium fujikuroi IMI 58289]SCN81966.1 uncharacterized protein FFB20_06639 [Fusarium fujikuroi]SCO11463.1 uncharacterized protein FFC1_11507 [Fusarium fujikuroi]
MKKLAQVVAYMHTSDIRPLVTDGVSEVFVRGVSTKFDDCSYILLDPEQVAHLERNLRADTWQLGCCFALVLGVAMREYEHSKKSLKALCDEGSSKGEALSNQLAYELVSGMLDKNHETRLEIHQVLSQIDQFVAQMNTAVVGDVDMSYL